MLLKRGAQHFLAICGSAGGSRLATATPSVERDSRVGQTNRPAHRSFLEVILAGSILVAAFTVLGQVAATQPTHGDERRWIERARYFSYLFIEHDVTRAEWGDRRWTHTQPMLANYVIGGRLWMSEVDLEDIRRQEVSDALVLAARTPMILPAAGSIVMLYLIGRLLGGLTAGLVAATLALTSPLAQEYLPQARSEPLLMFFVLLAFWCALIAERGQRRGRPTLGWVIAAGTAMGLALAAKLTALLSLIAILTWGLVIAGLAARQHGTANPRSCLHRAWLAGHRWAVALAVALLLFVISNPHLWPNPLFHSRHLMEHRLDELMDQQGWSFLRPGGTPANRLTSVLGGSLLGSTATGSRGLPLEALLAPVGAAVLLARSLSGWRRTGNIPADGLALLTVAVYFLGTSAGLIVVWERYFLPTLLFGTLLSGLGGAAVIAKSLDVYRASVSHPTQHVRHVS